MLDNTGSMLCGANDGTNSACSPDVVAADTSCTNSSNSSRICTLINASKTFVNTMTGALASTSQLYISVVPYVTTVNVGDSFCTGSTSCSHITQTGSVFTDLRGNMMPVTPIKGDTTSGSTISNVSFWGNGSWVSGTAAIQPGMYIYGHGIPSGATVSSVSSSSIVISSNATLTFTGNSLAVGPNSGNTSTPYTDPTTCTTTGTWTNGSTTVTSVGNTANTCVVAGMVVTSSSSGIPTSPATTVSSISGSHGDAVGQSATASSSPAQADNLQPGRQHDERHRDDHQPRRDHRQPQQHRRRHGNFRNRNTCQCSTSPVTTGSPPTSLTMSANATSTNTNDIVTLTNLGATTTTGSTTVSNVSFTPTVPSVGQIIIGNGIPANTTITAVTGTSAQFAAGTGTLTISQAATTPSAFSSATGACCNTTLVAFTPLTYDFGLQHGKPGGFLDHDKLGRLRDRADQLGRECECLRHRCGPRLRQPGHLRADDRDELVPVLLGEG